MRATVLLFAVFLLVYCQEQRRFTRESSIWSELDQESLPYEAPSIHPFESVASMEREQGKDCFGGFSTTSYKMNAKQAENLKNAKKRNRANAPSSFSVFKNSSLVLSDGTHLKIEYKAEILKGVLVLDNEESVMSVTCWNATTLEIAVDNSERAAQWVPGTRFVVGKGWNCTNHMNVAQDDPMLFLMIRRSAANTKESLTHVSFEVSPLKPEQLFVNAKISASSIPANKESTMPISMAQWHGSHVARDSNNDTVYSSRLNNPQKRYSTSGDYNLVNFNYDFASSTSITKDIYLYGSQGDASYSKCQNCYAYLGFGYKVDIEFDWFTLSRYEYCLQLTILQNESGCRR